MKSIIAVLASALLLSGCFTIIPKVKEFPPPPKTAMEPCDMLKTIDEATLSSMMKTVTVNYATYYQCAIKQNAWIEWYNIQQQIQKDAAE